MAYDYANKEAPKISDEFRKKFVIDTGRLEMMSLDGLVALGHIKGLWELKTEVLQYPSPENGMNAICACTLGGYDWDPVEEKITKVEYRDIGDANEDNCSKNVAKHFIRMASSRAQARVLRRYTNVDMVCSAEINEALDNLPPKEPEVSVETLQAIKMVKKEKHIPSAVLGNMLKEDYGVTDWGELTEVQGKEILEKVNQMPVYDKDKKQGAGKAQ